MALDKQKIIDGKAFAESLCEQLKGEVSALKAERNITPGLAVILVGEDPASSVYVANKNKKAADLGINSYSINLAADISEEELLKKIAELNNNSDVHGILVQLPLPRHIDKLKVINSIDPNKDVDGFHVENTGRLFTQQDCLKPCTPWGCILLLKEYLGDLTGKKAVIFGRSNIVGRPISEMLQQEDCTTVLLHSNSKNTKEESLTADIIIAAIGRPEFINSEYVKDGAVIIDVGINRVEKDGKNRLVGDVDFDDVIDKVSMITPVPGGVGPMTIACLMYNTIKAAKGLKR